MSYIGIGILMKRLGQRGDVSQEILPPSMSFWRVSMSGHVDGHRPKAQIGDVEGERGHLRGTAAPSMHKDNQRPFPPNPSDIVLAVAHLARLRHRFLFGGRIWPAL